MSTQCLNNITPIGNLCGQAAPLQKAAGIVLALPDQQFAAYTDFVDQADWLADIRDEKLFPIMELDDDETKDTEDNITTTATGKKIYNFDGTRSRDFKVTLPVSVHKALRNFGFQKLRVYIVDKNNNILGTNPSTTVVKGFKTSFFHVGKQNWDGFVTTITVDFSDVNEWDRFGVYVNPSWNVSDLTALTKIEATPSTCSAGGVFTVALAYVDDSEITSAGAKKSVAISGLDITSFEVYKQGGTKLTPTTDFTVTETSVPGTYTVDASDGSMTSGTVKIIATSTALYKSDTETVSAAP